MKAKPRDSPPFWSCVTWRGVLRAISHGEKKIAESLYVCLFVLLFLLLLLFRFVSFFFGNEVRFGNEIGLREVQ